MVENHQKAGKTTLKASKMGFWGFINLNFAPLSRPVDPLERLPEAG